MTGPEHYREAEQVLAQVKDRDVSAAEVAAYTAVAQVHATLATAAATALPRAGELPVADHDAWWAAAGSEPVWRDRGEVTP